MSTSRNHISHIIFYFWSACLLSLLVMGGCQKRNAYRQEKGENSEDNKNLMEILTTTAQDANNAASSVSLISGKIDQEAAMLLTIPCGSTLDTSSASNGILFLTFDGTTICEGKIRSGGLRLRLVDYSLGSRWRMAGSVLKLDFINFGVTKTIDSKSIRLNGSLHYSNVSGGTIMEMILGINNVSAVSHLAEGTDISVTFDDGTLRFMNISRKISYDFLNKFLSIKIEGAGNVNGLTNVESWGQTRAGDIFTSQVTEPISLNTNCFLWRPVAGRALLKVDNAFELTTTFGIDLQGNLVSPNSGSCPWGYKIEWSHRNRTNNRIIKYD